MLTRQREIHLLRPEDIPPSREELEVVGVFNPGVFDLGEEVVIVARVAERVGERREGQIALPRWDADGRGLIVDWLPTDRIREIDPRMVQRTDTGANRLTFTSHLRVYRSRDGLSIEGESARRFEPVGPLETYGVEDPRLTRLDGRVWMTYVAVSEHGAATALASTGDYETFERHGIIFFPENKDVLLFPERVGGEAVALHRPTTMTPFSPPEIWLARSPDLLHWGKYEVLLGGSAEWDSGRIGGGAPPLRIDEGWLEIYHGNHRSESGVGAYAAGALVLDADRPGRIRLRCPEPILTPERDYEKGGFVNDVVFPTGLVRRGDALRVYYGAADSSIGVVELSLDEMVKSLKGC